MADITRTIADNSGFIPQAWAQRALDVLRENMVLTRRVTRDSDFEPGWQGKQLNIPYPGTFAAQDKAADSVATVQTPTGGATINVTLSKHKYVDFIVEDFASAQASSNLLDRYVRPAAIALGNAVESDLFALQAGLSTIKGTIGTDLNAAMARTARQALNDNKVSPSDRALIISSKDETALLGDSNLQNYFAFARSQGVSQGSIGQVYGFDVAMSQLVPIGQAKVTLTGGPTGGTFTLTFGGQTTSGIAYNAAANAVQSAVVGLSTVGTGNATVAGPNGGPWTVTWAGPLASTLLLLSANGASLTGGTSPAAAVTSGYTNLAIHREAFILATRPFRDPPAGSGVQATSILDPETGLAIRVLYQYDINNRGVRVGFDILYGVAELRDAAGVVVLS